MWRKKFSSSQLRSESSSLRLVYFNVLRIYCKEGSQFPFTWVCFPSRVIPSHCDSGRSWKSLKIVLSFPSQHFVSSGESSKGMGRKLNLDSSFYISLAHERTRKWVGKESRGSLNAMCTAVAEFEWDQLSFNGWKGTWLWVPWRLIIHPVCYFIRFAKKARHFAL